MRLCILFGLVSLLSGFGLICYRNMVTRRGETVFEPAPTLPQLAPMCPWRNPEGDLPRLFPGALRFELETRILSGLRPEMARRLGRAPGPDENALQVFRIYHGDEPVGEVAARRVKGTFGAIEVVVAADNAGELRGVLIQRSREPQPVNDALLALDWARLAEKNAEDGWSTTDFLKGLPPQARASAQAIVDGTRDAMILLSISRQAGQVTLAKSHRH